MYYDYCCSPLQEVPGADDIESGAPAAADAAPAGSEAGAVPGVDAGEAAAPAAAAPAAARAVIREGLPTAEQLRREMLGNVWWLFLTCRVVALVSDVADFCGQFWPTTGARPAGYLSHLPCYLSQLPCVLVAAAELLLSSSSVARPLP